MKKIKLVILVCGMVLLSGCSAEYNLTIDETIMEENISAIFDKKTESDYASRMEKIRRTAYYNFDTRENEYYTFNKTEDDNNIFLNYNYKYTNNNLYKSEAVSRCYYKRIVNVTENNITINTDNQVACIYKDGNKEIDSITVNIRTDLIVLEHNADKVNDKVYTWYINDENYSNKPIYIKMEKEKSVGSFVDQTISIVIIVLIIIAIGIIIYLRAHKKHLQNNKIN